MNITFLIGNGFDINLGLKTRYTDFYPYYLSQRHDDIISNAIANHYDRWADLGQHRINAKNRIIQWVPNKNCE